MSGGLPRYGLGGWGAMETALGWEAMSCIQVPALPCPAVCPRASCCPNSLRLSLLPTQRFLPKGNQGASGLPKPGPPSEPQSLLSVLCCLHEVSLFPRGNRSPAELAHSGVRTAASSCTPAQSQGVPQARPPGWAQGTLGPDMPRLFLMEKCRQSLGACHGVRERAWRQSPGVTY